MENKIKSEILVAMKNGDGVKKNILRLVLGEFQQKNISADSERVAVIRKIVKSNEETISLSKQNNIQTDISTLEKENEILISLLPKQLVRDEIVCLLRDNTDIKTAKSDGQAVGVAMKVFKTANALVDASLVKTIVTELRNG